MNNKKSSLSLGAMKNSMCTSKMNHGSAAADALANLLRLGFFRYPAANNDDRSAHVNGLMEDTVALSLKCCQICGTICPWEIKVPQTLELLSQ
jgi:hypothetical protein